MEAYETGPVNSSQSVIETGNIHDPHAVVVQQSIIVGHELQAISSPLLLVPEKKLLSDV